MMNDQIILIKECQFKMVIRLLNKHEITYRVPAYPKGKVELIESIPSKMNDTHDDLLEFAKKKGFKNVAEAIASEGGSGRRFKRKYLKEHSNG